MNARMGGAGEMTAARVEAAAKAIYEGQHPYLPWERTTSKQTYYVIARAALAAAQTAQTEGRVDLDWCLRCGRGWSWIDVNTHRIALEIAEQQGFAAGIEAAAKWHDERATRCREAKYFDLAADHERAAQQIRALRPAETAESTTLAAGWERDYTNCPVCGNHTSALCSYPDCPRRMAPLLSAAEPAGPSEEDIQQVIELLTWLDRLGGLGYDKHERIRAVLALLCRGQ